jgi:hypothetical protein
MTPSGWIPSGYKPPSSDSKRPFAGCLGLAAAIVFALLVVLLLVFLAARV